MPAICIGCGKPAMLIVVSTALGLMSAPPVCAQYNSAPSARVGPSVSGSAAVAGPARDASAGSVKASSALALPGGVEVAVPIVATQATQGARHLSLGTPLAPGHLAQARGTGASIDTTLGGTVSSNSATQVTTGANIIQDGAFAGASGMPVVIQNTGANVLIQNATVIHLRLQ